VPNFVRGSAIFAVSGFAYLKGSMGVLNAAMLVGSICFGGALLCLLGMDETFSRDLDYSEEG
ncbi:MAG: MFS transporter, partial [Proteobacteria bacterium]